MFPGLFPLVSILPRHRVVHDLLEGSANDLIPFARHLSISVHVPESLVILRLVTRPGGGPR